MVNACLHIPFIVKFERSIFKTNNNLYGGLNLNKFFVQISFENRKEKGKIAKKTKTRLAMLRIRTQTTVVYIVKRRFIYSLT